MLPMLILSFKDDRSIFSVPAVILVCQWNLSHGGCRCGAPDQFTSIGFSRGTDGKFLLYITRLKLFDMNSLRVGSSNGTGFARLMLISALLTSLATAPILFYHRRRIILLIKALIDRAAALSSSTGHYSVLLDQQAQAVRSYIDHSAGHMYALLATRFESQLDRLVDSALLQAKALIIDPDMPVSLSNLLADSIDRIRPELTRAIRRKANTAILSPLVRRLKLSRDSTLSNLGAGELATLHHKPREHGAASVATRRHSITHEVTLTQSERSFHSRSPLLLQRGRTTLPDLAREVLLCMMWPLQKCMNMSISIHRTARAHVLYTLQPFDRSMWSCFQDPQYWFFNLLGATPLPSWLPAVWWLLVFLWQVGRLLRRQTSIENIDESTRCAGW